MCVFEWRNVPQLHQLWLSGRMCVYVIPKVFFQRERAVEEARLRRHRRAEQREDGERRREDPVE